MKSILTTVSAVLILVRIRNVTGADYRVELTSDAPIVKGGTVNFYATVYEGESLASKQSLYYEWIDLASPTHSKKTDLIESPKNTWTVTYDADVYKPGRYLAQVAVSKCYFTMICSQIASETIYFDVTETLNGRLSLSQNNSTVDGDFVSAANATSHSIRLETPDEQYVDKATAVLTYWFVDCVYYGVTTGRDRFDFNYTEADRIYAVEALIVADFAPLPPPTTTTTTTTTAKPTTAATTTAKPTVTTKRPKTTTETPKTTKKTVETSENRPKRGVASENEPLETVNTPLATVKELETSENRPKRDVARVNEYLDTVNTPLATVGEFETSENGSKTRVARVNEHLDTANTPLATVKELETSENRSNKPVARVNEPLETVNTPLSTVNASETSKNRSKRDVARVNEHLETVNTPLATVNASETSKNRSKRVVARVNEPLTTIKTPPTTANTPLATAESSSKTLGKPPKTAETDGAKAKRDSKTSKTALGSEKLPESANSKVKMLVNGTLVPFDASLPYVCDGARPPQRSTIVYGYFSRTIESKAPITGPNVTGNNWIHHGDLLSSK